MLEERGGSFIRLSYFAIVSRLASTSGVAFLAKVRKVSKSARIPSNFSLSKRFVYIIWFFSEMIEPMINWAAWD